MFKNSIRLTQSLHLSLSIPIMLDFYITEALITERLLDNYVSIDIVDEANLIYESVDGPYQVKRDGGISIKILGRAEGTIFDGEHELNVEKMTTKKGEK